MKKVYIALAVITLAFAATSSQAAWKKGGGDKCWQGVGGASGNFYRLNFKPAGDGIYQANGYVQLVGSGVVADALYGTAIEVNDQILLVISGAGATATFINAYTFRGFLDSASGSVTMNYQVQYNNPPIVEAGSFSMNEVACP